MKKLLLAATVLAAISMTSLAQDAPTDPIVIKTPTVTVEFSARQLERLPPLLDRAVRNCGLPCATDAAVVMNVVLAAIAKANKDAEDKKSPKADAPAAGTTEAPK